MKIELRESSKGNWRWYLIARNGRILAHSEVYASKQMCGKTANNVYDGTVVRITEVPMMPDGRGWGSPVIVRDRYLEDEEFAGEHI
jgi:uncharacterized protein YegP (UPF0339 family)